MVTIPNQSQFNVKFIIQKDLNFDNRQTLYLLSYKKIYF